MQNTSLATDPHTGITYDFQPIFNWPKESQDNMRLYTEMLHGAIGLMPYAFLYTSGPVLQVDAIGSLEALKDMHRAFSEVILSAEHLQNRLK